MSPGGKLAALACHPTKIVNKAEELTYLFTNIGMQLKNICQDITNIGILKIFYLFIEFPINNLAGQFLSLPLLGGRAKITACHHYGLSQKPKYTEVIINLLPKKTKNLF
jgi:hypothetical protein